MLPITLAVNVAWVAGFEPTSNRFGVCHVSRLHHTHVLAHRMGIEPIKTWSTVKRRSQLAHDAKSTLYFQYVVIIVWQTQRLRKLFSPLVPITTRRTKQLLILPSCFQKRFYRCLYRPSGDTRGFRSPFSWVKTRWLSQWSIVPNIGGNYRTCPDHLCIASAALSCWWAKFPFTRLTQNFRSTGGTTGVVFSC